MNLNPDFNRRSFLAAMLGACAAPAIVKAANIMPIWVPRTEILLPNQEVEVFGAEYLDALNGWHMSGGSACAIAEGRCRPYKTRDCVYMGYRFDAHEDHGKPAWLAEADVARQRRHALHPEQDPLIIAAEAEWAELEARGRRGEQLPMLSERRYTRVN